MQPYLVNAALGIVASALVTGLAGLGVSAVARIIGIAAVGLLQWLVLRRYVRRIGWLGWVLAAILGQLAGTFLAILVSVPVLLGTLGDLGEAVGGSTVLLGVKLVTDAVIGSAVGFAQWLVLRRHFYRAVWWIAASMVAGMIAWVLTNTSGSEFGLGGPLGWVAARLASGVCVGALTGIALAWLMEKHKKEYGS